MKILRVVSDLYPYSYGGLGIHAHELSKSIANKGHEVTVFSCGKENKSYHSFVDGYELYNFKPFLDFFGNAIAPSMLFSLSSKIKDFDIIHAHSHLFFSTNLTTFVKKFKKTPFIITNHGLVSQTAPINLQKIFLPTIAKWTFINAEAVICYTPEMKKEMENWSIPSNNVHIIHNGVNVEHFKPLDEKKEYDIIWIGRYVPGKGVEYLINSISELRRDIKDLKVLMIGSGPLKKNIDKMVSEMDLNNNIHFIEKISNIDLPVYYNKSKIFILTSLEEGVPRTLLEAMSCGLPVVCSNLPQLKKLVEGCGILVPKKDISYLVNVIKEIMNSPELAKKLGQNARRRVVEEYSWDDTVNKTLRLYEELIN